MSYGYADKMELSHHDIKEELRVRTQNPVRLIMACVFFAFSAVFFAVIPHKLDTAREGAEWLGYFIAALFLSFEIFLIQILRKALAEQKVIRNGRFTVVEDVLERKGNEESEKISFFDSQIHKEPTFDPDRPVRYARIRVRRGCGRARIPIENNTQSWGERTVLPFYFKEHGKAIYGTRRWAEECEVGEKFILVIYEDGALNIDCPIMLIYPSKYFKYTR